MKDNKEVISEFNEYVNMTASELEKWLKSDDSNSAGWTKDGGDGESVGHDSGRKIVEILKSNPDKTPDKYTEDQLAHMRKVASYCKRHLAQESAGNDKKDAEELKETKSYISLKNWGHDFLKANGKVAKGEEANGKEAKGEESKGEESKGKESGSASNGSKSGSKKKAKKDDDVEEKAEGEADGEEEKNADDAGSEQEENGEDDKKTGDKRKKSGEQKGSNKKQETRKTRSTKKNASEDEDKDEEMAGEEGNGDAEEDAGEEEEEENDDEGGKPSKKGPKKGETVSWKWGSGNPKGKVLDVKEEKATITTKNGNKVSRDGDPEDPAVILDAGKSKAIKSAHELN